MVDRDVLSAKVDAIAAHVESIRVSGALDSRRFLGDRVLQDATLFNLTQAVQASVDAGAMILAGQGWETPTSLGQTFLLLADHGVLDRAHAGQMAQLAGLRNLVVHRYAVLDLARVHRDLAVDLGTLDRFVAVLRSSPSRPS